MDPLAVQFLFALAPGLFILALLPSFGQRPREAAYLGVILLVTCLILATRLAAQLGSELAFYFSFASVPLWWLHGPALFLYVRARLFQSPFAEDRKLWFAVAPVIGIFGLHVLLATSQSWMWERSAIRDPGGPGGRYYLGVILAGSVYAEVWFGLAWRTLRRYKSEFADHYSGEGEAGFRRLSVLVALSLLWFALTAVAALVGLIFPHVLGTTGAPVNPLPPAIMLYLLVQHLLKAPRSLALPERSDRKRYARSGLTASARQTIAAAVKKAMEDGKLYCDPELTLRDLAEACDAPVHQVSAVINGELGTNFNALVNDHRARDLAALLARPELAERTILNLGMQAGFNSKAGMNRAFKRSIGTTPRQYRKRELAPPASA